MVRVTDFGRIKKERKNLSFFKIFRGSDLSCEIMRMLPRSFLSSFDKKDFSYKMVLRAKWGSSWEVPMGKNTRIIYMEKDEWEQFVSDNALGQNEFVTFTHRGKMIFDVNIYAQNCKEIAVPRKPQSTAPASGFKEVKKEEETAESMGGVEDEVGKKKTAESSKKKKEVVNPVGTVEYMGRVERRGRKKKAKETKTSKKKEKKAKSKKVVMERGESSRGVLIVRKKKAEELKASNKKTKKRISTTRLVNGIPEFTITIKHSYLKFLAIPKEFEVHLPDSSKSFKMHHENRNDSWKVLCLVRETRSIFSSGWTQIAREYPFLVGDVFTFRLVKPYEFRVVAFKKAREEEILMIEG